MSDNSDLEEEDDNDEDQTLFEEEALNEMRLINERPNDTACIDQLAVSASSVFTSRRVFLATMLIATTIIGTSVLMYSGSDFVVVAHSLPKFHVVDVNGPPLLSATSTRNSSEGSSVSRKTKKSTKKKTKKKKSKTKGGAARMIEDDEELGPLLVVKSDDDQIPVGVSKDSIFSSSNTNLHASDALECRQSVIAFVINATDGKDECDGLKRAFDKTCNSDAPEESTSTSETTSEQRHRQRRLLFEASQTDVLHRKLKALVFETSRWIRVTLARQLMPEQPIAFFAEDEVTGTAWDDAEYLVENKLDELVHKDLSRRLKKRSTEDVAEVGQDDNKWHPAQTNKEVAREKKNAETDDMTKDEESIQTDQQDDTSSAGIDTQKGESPIDDKAEKDEETEMEQEVPATKDPKPIVKPKQSLTLPTANQHVSETMLSETLLLQKEDTIKKAIETYANQTNVTMNEAAIDAATSSKAVQEVSAVVSAVLNDPTSVEARTCCASILNVFHENCDTPDQEEVSDKKLFLIVFVLAFCGMVKSLIRYYQVRWLPEAAGCILVGVLCGAMMSFVPHYDISFDGDWFLRIMVPPIVFEAALSINKKSFNRHIWPIMIYAVAGTLLATGITAFIVHKGTSMLSGCETIPYVESLTFGALISSIDPIAVLSVLNSMGMTDTDSIYVVIFGESLLNDGVALVLFQTLVHFLDESLVIDTEAVTAAAIHFCVVAFGSLCVGIGSGVACAFYYWMMQGCQTPLVEVLLFFCWAFIPYYICDGIGWSGIVAVVATGFVMDLYVVGQVDTTDDSFQTSRSHDNKNVTRRAFSNIHGHLSSLAKTHVGFVAELLSTMMETAIFAYLGVFLFSYRYHWNFLHTFLAVFACCTSRAIMIPLLSLAANWVARIQQARATCHKKKGRRGVLSTALSAPSPGVVVDKKMQLVLWVAGLRGAMSFALVENIPLYDTVTQQGSRLKSELKAMTSASIVFTVFVLGGYTFYLMEYLGLGPSSQTISSTEASPFVKRGMKDEPDLNLNNSSFEEANDRSKVRQRTHING